MIGNVIDEKESVGSHRVVPFGDSWPSICQTPDMKSHQQEMHPDIFRMNPVCLLIDDASTREYRRE